MKYIVDDTKSISIGSSSAPSAPPFSLGILIIIGLLLLLSKKR